MAPFHSALTRAYSPGRGHAVFHAARPEDRLADVPCLFQHPDRRPIVGKWQRKEPQEIRVREYVGSDEHERFGRNTAPPVRLA